MSRVIKAPSIDASPCRIGLAAEGLNPSGQSPADPSQRLREAEAKAREILAEAGLERETLLQKARTEAQAMKTQAQHQGKAAGLQEARNEIRKEVESRLAQVAAVATAAQDAMSEMVQKHEKQLVALAAEIAGRIVKDRIAVDDEVVVRNAEEAIRRAVQKESLKIRVNPRDLITLRGFQEDFLVSFDAIREIVIEEDNRVTVGGCIVETGSGNVEARVEKQLEEIARALLAR